MVTPILRQGNTNIGLYTSPSLFFLNIYTYGLRDPRNTRTLTDSSSIALFNKDISIPQQTMAATPLQLTFGVEFECVFAFHEPLLQQHLDKVHDSSKIIKTISEAARVKLNRAPQRHLTTRRTYNSWGLTSPTQYPYGDEELGFQDSAEEHRQEYGYRGYGNEVLYIAHSILPSGVAVHDSFARKREDFSTWHLANDTTLVG